MTDTPITNESEAMEVWRRAKDTFAGLGQVLGRDGRHRDATDGDRHQAAARAIATALEARDSEIAELKEAFATADRIACSAIQHGFYVGDGLLEQLANARAILASTANRSKAA